MYLLWKTNNLGRLNVSRDGLQNFANTYLPDGYKCRDISFDADESEIMAVVTLPQVRNSIEMAMVEEKLKKGFSSLGFTSKLAWAETASDHSFRLSSLGFGSPLLWAVLAASASGIYLLGPSGIAWVVLFGIVGYLVSRFLLLPDKNKFLKDLKDRFRR
ncbi:MAG TPA: hypothetical protein PLV56_01245 [Synergistales bacterium]|nr:hypothetical protein [Synergistales bacterium]